MDEENKSLKLVTIITVTLNSEKTIARTIESVLNQTYANIEYIIIDGLSSDNTVSIAESYREEFEKKVGRSILIISEKDAGMYDALNKGAMLANGELVGQINGDDWYEIDAVKTMVQLYEKERYDVAWGSIVVHGKREWIKHAHVGLIWSTSGWCHPAMFSKKEMLIQFPYAQESMYDDFDYITSVYKAKKKIVTIDKVISHFSFGKGGKSTTKSFRELKKRVNTTYSIYKKHNMSKLYYLYRWIYESIKYCSC